MSSNAVIGNTGFSEGVHYWEIICPIFCNSIGKSTTRHILRNFCAFRIFERRFDPLIFIKSGLVSDLIKFCELRF